MSKALDKVALLLLSLISIVIGMKLMKEPDMWWYMLTGEWIVNNGQVPVVDPFSYTFNRTEWINVKWLYEVIVYGFSQLGGPEVIALFQSFISVMIALLIVRIGKTLNTNSRSIGVYLLAFVVMIGSGFRMTARPETISHLFVLLVLFLFLKYRSGNKKWILLLIPLQALWTNLHEAYGVGMVLILAISGAELVERKLLSKPFSDKFLIAAAAGSIFAPALSPRGLEMITHPLNIFGQLGANKFTTELYAVSTSFWWQQWQSWLFLAMMTMIVVLLVLNLSRTEWKWQNTIVEYPFGLLLSLALLAYLGFTAHRNIPFFLLASSPVLAKLIDETKVRVVFEKRFSWIALCGLMLLGYIGIVSQSFYKLSNSTDRFGLGVYSEFTPIGLGQHLQSIDYKSPHFSDFNSSAYSMWALRPDYQSFIDLRDLDIYPPEFFRDVMLCNDNPRYFEFFDEQYAFEYAYMNRLSFAGLINQLHQNPNWRLDFADPVAVLFTKNPKRDRTQDVFSGITVPKRSALASIVTSIFNPLYVLPNEIEDEALMASYFYQQIGEFDLALKRLEKKEDMESLCLKGELLNSLAMNETNVGASKDLSDQSFKTLQRALSLEKDDPRPHLALGKVYLSRQMFADAMGQFKKVSKLDPKNAPNWAMMADLQNDLSALNPGSEQRYEKKWFEYLTKAAELDPDNMIYAFQLGVSHCQRNNCDEAKTYLSKIGPMAQLSQAENDLILDCKKRCNAE